jgi:hypothetical protein
VLLNWFCRISLSQITGINHMYISWTLHFIHFSMHIHFNMHTSEIIFSPLLLWNSSVLICLSFDCALQILLFFVSYKLNVCSNPAYSSLWVFFPIVHAYFMCLCHILAISQISSFSVVIMSVMVIWGQWSLTVLLYLFWCSTNHSHIRPYAWSINFVCVLTI